MAKIIPYNPNLKPLAQKLRKNMTFGEILLWNELKGDKFLGFDFDRQRCIDNYIVDFYCKELMFAIEIDGIYHTYEETFTNDRLRQNRLESLGVTIIRFSENDVKNDIVNVLRLLNDRIIEIIKRNPDIILPIGFDISLLDNYSGPS